MLAFEASVDIDVKPPREHVEASSDPVPEHAEAFEAHVKIEEEPVALAAVSEAPVEALNAAPGSAPLPSPSRPHANPSGVAFYTRAGSTRATRSRVNAGKARLFPALR